jgi:hypothetical protein
MKIIGKINTPLYVAPSGIHGKGVFSKQRFAARKKVGALSGVLISKKEARQKVKEQKAIHMVELWNGKALDCSEFRNELAYINHSCKPNCYMRNINNWVEFYSLRPIKAKEELTCNYGETHHDGKLKCQCGCEGCIGNL